jgi:hypothetical protein
MMKFYPVLCFICEVISGEVLSNEVLPCEVLSGEVLSDSLYDKYPTLP